MKVRVTRRQVLRYAVVAGVGVATATLVSCAPTQESPRPTAAPAPPTQPPAVVLPQATSTTPPQPAATVQAAVTPTARPAVAASPTPAPAVKRGGILKTSSVINYPSMDPHLNGTIGQTGYGMLFDPLLGFKYRMDPPRWEVTPALATSWEIPDPLTVILRLRQGVKFTDGSDWNAEVARWNLLRIRDHPKSFFKTVVDVIEDVGTTDSHTVKLKLKRPSAAIFANLTEAAGSIYMISKAAHDKLGDEGIATSPSGTGPMVLERWVRDNVVELKRKNDYWAKGTDGKPLPYLDGYHDYYRPDPTVAIAELRAGTVDIVQEPDPKDRAALQARPEIAVLEHPSAGYGYFGYGLNPKTKLFQDRRVRLAFAHAIEREAMVKTLSFGYGKPHYVRRWAPGVLGYEEGAYPKYDFSPDKVKQYLTEAGYPEGIDVTMAVINRALDMRQAELVKAVWDKVGIRTKLDVMEQVAWSSKVRAGQFEVASHRPASYADPDLIRVVETCGQTGNWFGWCNKEFDSLMEKGGSTYDAKERHSIYRQAVKVMVEDAWTGVAYMTYYTFAMQQRVKNFSTNWVWIDGREIWLDS